MVGEEGRKWEEKRERGEKGEAQRGRRARVDGRESEVGWGREGKNREGRSVCGCGGGEKGGKVGKRRLHIQWSRFNCSIPQAETAFLVGYRQ